jgi:hypothetical protein
LAVARYSDDPYSFPNADIADSANNARSLADRYADPKSHRYADSQYL